MANFDLTITWGQRVKIYNLFPVVGTLAEMHVSNIMRNVMLGSATAQDLSTNGITLNGLGMYTIPEKNENRPSSITMNENEIDLFASFILNLSDKRQVHLAHEDVFSRVIAQYNENHAGHEGGE